MIEIETGGEREIHMNNRINDFSSIHLTETRPANNMLLPERECAPSIKDTDREKLSNFWHHKDRLHCVHLSNTDKQILLKGYFSQK